jgi:hypothetical protein
LFKIGDLVDIWVSGFSAIAEIPCKMSGVSEEPRRGQQVVMNFDVGEFEEIGDHDASEGG